VLNTWRMKRWIPTISLGMCCSIQCDKKVTDTTDLRWNWKWKIIIFLTPNTTVWTAADINKQNVTTIISEFRHYVTNQFYLYSHTLDIILKVYKSMWKAVLIMVVCTDHVHPNFMCFKEFCPCAP
jgi:hypothetical protein